MEDTRLCLGGCGDCEHQTVLVVHYCNDFILPQCYLHGWRVFFHEVAEEGVMVMVAYVGVAARLPTVKLSSDDRVTVSNRVWCDGLGRWGGISAVKNGKKTI